MNNVDKLQELRGIAMRHGYPKEHDRQFYIPIRTRVDGRSYIPGNGDHALLFEPEWLICLLGDSEIETNYIDREKLEPLKIPIYESMMIDLARIRARKGDTIGHLYAIIKRGEK